MYGMRKTLISLIVALCALIAAGSALAQEPPPTAMARFANPFPVEDQARQYDLAKIVLEFAPGDATGLQRHGGTAFMSVVSGEVSLIQDGMTTTAGPGGSFRVERADAYSLVNAGTTDARLVQSLLLSPGAQATLSNDDSANPPQITYQARITLGVQPAAFTFFHLLIDVPEGGIVPLHDHAGPGLVMTLEGNLVHEFPMGDFAAGTGDVVLDEGSHAGHIADGGPVLLWASFLIPPNTPPVLPPASETTSIQPPSTGDAGLKETVGLPLGGVVAGVVVMVAVSVLAARDRLSRRPKP